MTTEFRPLGAKCNLKCTYCYQNPERESAPVPRRYDLHTMKARAKQLGGPVTIFGGEPLLLPMADLEDLLAFGYSEFGSNGIQTNGSLIGPAHIDLFRRYSVQVGISIDGPADLNDERITGAPRSTRLATRRTEAAIRQLCDAGIPPSLIVTLHSRNATETALPRMNEWFRELDGTGIRKARLHILELPPGSPHAHLALTTAQNIAAFQNFYDLEQSLPALSFDVFTDIRSLLVGSGPRTTCVWNACDPYTTRAVQGIEGDGQTSNCGHVLHDGVNFLKADVPGYERYLHLYTKSQDSGGCAGCRFFYACKGQCPGGAIDADWRNRSAHCGVWKYLFARVESDLELEGIEPLSSSPLRLEVEALLMDGWRSGVNPDLFRIVERLRKTAPAATAKAPPPACAQRRHLGLGSARVIWTSSSAKAAWESRVERLRACRPFLDSAAVQEGLVDCALLWLTEPQAPQIAEHCSRLGQVLVPVGTSPEGAEPSDKCFVVGPADPVAKFSKAWTGGDAATIGQLLGWPRCCLTASTARWRAGEFDLVWMASGGHSTLQHGSLVVTRFVSTNNQLWSALGLRLAPHWSCAPDCTRSQQRAQALLRLMPRIGLSAEQEWLLELLSWPCEWSALNGIAEVRSPILSFTYETDDSPGRRVVRQLGTVFPKEGARGTDFPYLRGQPEKGEAR